jgi:hypothetical protein
MLEPENIAIPGDRAGDIADRERDVVDALELNHAVRLPRRFDRGKFRPRAQNKPRDIEIAVAKFGPIACVGGMRRVVSYFCIVLSLFVSATVAEAQGARPQFRPAVLGSGPTSLINRIDSKELAKKGQKDGAVMFCAIVAPTGNSTAAWTYRGMPGTEALEQELNRVLKDAKFTAPIYNYQPVSVLLYGTAIFTTADVTPSVRIFLNQDPREFGAMTDFISPQPVFGGDSGFRGLRAPEAESAVSLTAVVDIGLKVSADGKLEDLRVLKEEPPLLGYGEAAMANFRDARFIPAFRSGDPTASDTLLPVCYKQAD